MTAATAAAAAAQTKTFLERRLEQTLSQTFLATKHGQVPTLRHLGRGGMCALRMIHAERSVYVFFTVITTRASAFYPLQLLRADWHSGSSVATCLCRR